MKSETKIGWQEARAFARTLGLKNRKEWYVYCKSGQKPASIIWRPDITYKNNGWVSWGDWLGTNFISTRYRKYKSFEEARELARSLSLKGVQEWQRYAKSNSRPQNISSNPSLTYKGKGWVSWGNFLGTNRGSKRSRVFMEFAEARSFTQSLRLNNCKEWKVYCKSINRPTDLPTNPDKIYKDKGWISWKDFLGIPKNRSAHLPFHEAREFARSLSLRGIKEWQRYAKSGERPKNIPFDGRRAYKENGWVSWRDWLGISNNHSKYLSFHEAREFARSLFLKEAREWRTYSKSGIRPKNIPASPNYIYKDKGWTSWPDWLGSATPSRKSKG